MRISVHLGIHFSDKGQFNWSLRKNKKALESKGRFALDKVEVDAIRQVITKNTIEHGGFSKKFRSLKSEESFGGIERIILSSPDILGQESWSIRGDMVYASAERNLGRLRKIFDGYELEFFLGLVDPSIWLTELASRNSAPHFVRHLKEISPNNVRWIGLIERIRSYFPEEAINVWANEDTPYIWGEIMEKVTGLSEGDGISFKLDLVQSLLSSQGKAWLRMQRQINKTSGSAEWEETISHALDKYSKPEFLTKEVEVPGWDAKTLKEVSRRYSLDFEALRDMGGVFVL